MVTSVLPGNGSGHVGQSQGLEREDEKVNFPLKNTDTLHNKKMKTLELTYVSDLRLWL